jgi:alpha-glucosidase
VVVAEVDAEWWRTAVIYQIYPRSFADANGDGIGDLVGITQRLDALVSLGIDAVWLSPFYPSPQRDAGYDVADYCGVDPIFGTLADFDDLLASAHRRGLKVIIDLVPNHTSSAHPWFTAALDSSPGSPERRRYLFRDQPTDWQSVFGGSAWTQVPDGQWYMHLYDEAQPDLNWRSLDVRALFVDVLRFWLDRGVDGFRVDVAHGLIKDDSFPSYPGPPLGVLAKAEAPYWDQEEVHEIYRSWRALLDEYTAADPTRPRVLCAEANVSVPRAVRYVRPDEMHQAFNFPYLNTRWDAGALREVIDVSLTAFAEVGAPSTWVLSNHDVVRHATRLGYPLDQPAGPGIGLDDPQPDVALGLRRARAATMLMLALPGSAYLYQGEELGLPEHTELPDEFRQDPNWVRKNYTEKGRDGARIPLPWLSGAPALGFGTLASTWLPQPTTYRTYARDVQETEPDSTLSMYRSALRLRRGYGLGGGTLRWRPETSAEVLSFSRGPVQVTANLDRDAVPLPAGAEILLASSPEFDGRVGTDMCVWWLDADTSASVE